MNAAAGATRWSLAIHEDVRTWPVPDLTICALDVRLQGSTGGEQRELRRTAFDPFRTSQPAPWMSLAVLDRSGPPERRRTAWPKVTIAPAHKCPVSTHEVTQPRNKACINQGAGAGWHLETGQFLPLPAGS